jgi:DNA-binding XRE family transcriptional regulator
MHLNIPQPVKVLAEHRYAAIVGDKTTRGDTRAGIVAACIFYAFIHTGNKRTGEEIRKMFKLSKKDMSKGLGRYLDVFAEDRTISNKPIDLIPRTMNRVGIDSSHYPAILALANMLEGTSRNMSHSCPQSVAASIVYLYLCINDEYRQRRGITKSMFAKLVSLSDITISRHLREACEILEKLRYPGIENAKRNMKRRKSDEVRSEMKPPSASSETTASPSTTSEEEPEYVLVKLAPKRKTRRPSSDTKKSSTRTRRALKAASTEESA